MNKKVKNFIFIILTILIAILILFCPFEIVLKYIIKILVSLAIITVLYLFYLLFAEGW